MNLVRGVNPWPGAYTHLDGKPLKVWKAAAATRPVIGAGIESGPVRAPRFRDRPRDDPRRLLHEGLLVACGGSEAVALLNVQTEGKKPLTAPEFLRGRALAPGTARVAGPPRTFSRR